VIARARVARNFLADTRECREIRATMMRSNRCRRSLGVLALAMALLQGCRSLPSLASRPGSAVLAETSDTRLGRAVAADVAAHPGLSGIVTLEGGRESFAARTLLADAADRTLDVQYYIWHDDLAGRLLLGSMLRAADRGVRVRLLLDDNNSSASLDRLLAALGTHPRIEVRLFNPFLLRGWHLAGYLTDFSRLNRRMHNKAFTVDNQVTLIGGRNVGNEYFGASDDVTFIDLDALAVGPVVNAVSRDFDRYWASASAYPVGSLLSAPGPDALAEVSRQLNALRGDPTAQAYAQAGSRQPVVRALLEHRLALEWAPVRVISDDPAKALDAAHPEAGFLPQLEKVLGAPRRELELVSPYFVPTAAGTRYLADLTRRGVKVSVLTNSLEATDVIAVHAGYAKWRKQLLRAGVALYEAKRELDSPRARARHRLGSAPSSLHAKTVAIDRERIFIGSFNFDPRSALLNTEIGFVIDSPTLAASLADGFAGDIRENTYEVRLDPHGLLIWIEHKGDLEIVHHHEPGAGFWRKLGARFLSWLPIESLL